MLPGQTHPSPALSRRLLPKHHGGPNLTDTSDYWDAYYGAKAETAVPSQFASFVLSEFNSEKTFVDIGCGDGRDTLFFAQYGKDVLGLDGSEAALDLCRRSAEARGLTNTQFTHLDLNDPDSHEDLAARLNISDAVVYARFFLHAIDEVAQTHFLSLASALAGKTGVVCLEFRTPRDEFQTKVTSDHYRRYVDPWELMQTCVGYNLKCTFFVEGFGFAKYRTDDAFVARLVLKPA